MSKTSFKGSLLATTVIAGITIATPAWGQMSAPSDNKGMAPTDAKPAAMDASMGDAHGMAAPADQTASMAAPAAAPTGNEIVITGTLIRNPNLVASAPVTVVGQEEMRLRQTNVAEEVLRTIPGAAPGIGAQVNNGANGSAFVNLRSLGANRNIVLLDGVRLVPADLQGRVDLNIIPLALVDRVDVLTGGASSTYGADAIAGVINFVTRNDFAGMDLSVSDQITQRGDGNTFRTDLTIGANFDDGRGNAVLSIGYQESDPVYQGGDRPWSNLALSSGAPGNLVSAGSSTTAPSRFEFGGGNNQQVSPDGLGLQPYYLPYNFNPYNIFQVPFKRYNMFGAAHYDITNHLTVYGRGIFSDNTIDQIIAPSGVFGSTVTIPINNAFMSAAQRNYFCANGDFNPAVAGNQTLTPAECAAAANPALRPGDAAYRQFRVGLRRRTPEVGPRITDFHTQTFDFRAGIRGDITDKIGFDVFAARGHSDRVNTIQNYVLLSRTQQALLASSTTSCFDTSNSCVPMNIFGQTGTITSAMSDFLTQDSTVQIKSQLSQIHGTINGDTPLQLWAKNPVSFAVGAEYRKNHAQRNSDSLSKQPGELGGAGGALPDINGGYDVYEGFTEVIAPIVSDKPFADELQVEAGIRRSRYTIDAPGTPKFSTTTWKIAGDWAPVRDIKIRANYQHAVRAPNIAELFTPIATGLTNLNTDPCAGAAPLNNANLRAICLAQGAPAGSIGTITNPSSGQALLTAGGDLTLRPETANTWTVGTVLRPRFLPGFSATIDYYKIRITHAITLPTPDDLINNCFGNITAASASSVPCTIIRRNPILGTLDGSPAEVPGLFAQLSNSGKITTDGIDVTFDYRRKLGTIMGAPAKIALNFGGNWTNSQKFQAVYHTSPKLPVQSLNRECVGLYSANCGFPAGALLPKYTFNQRTTLSLGRVDLSVLWRHIDKMRYEPILSQLFSGTINSTPTTSPFYGGPGTFNGETVNFNRIPAANYFDWTTRFNVSEHFDLTFTVQNLFDKQPPIVGNTAGTTTQNTGNTFPSTYDPLGRRFAAGARIKF